MTTTESTPFDAADPAEEQDARSPIAAQLDAATAELVKLREDSLRERADLENQRKRLERERDMARKFANERLLGELLPVIDSLEAGLKVPGDTAPHLRDGMELTLRQLMKVVTDNGRVAVDPAGLPFNPDQHQAMSMVASAEHAPGHVVQVSQKGGLLNDRLLRPALVVVSEQG